MLVTLLNADTLNKFDSESMYKIYDKWPDIAKESFESKLNPVEFKDIDYIVFAGMGGSGTMGDLFYSLFSKTKIHVNVVKGYHLPNTVDSNTLVVTTSVSGNTQETLTILDSAKKLGCKIIGFSSGGKMQDYCEKNNIQYQIIPQYNSPRSSFSSYLYSILNVLRSIIPIDKNDVMDSISKLSSLSKEISSSNLTTSNSSLNLAEWISGTPLIYYPWGFQAAAIRFKNSLQENAKYHAMTENIIEACHNGIVSWERPSNVIPILLEGEDDHLKTKERWQILKEYFKTNNIEYREVFSVKGSILSKLVNLIYFLDYTTIYRAILSEIDPSSIKSIDFVKNRL